MLGMSCASLTTNYDMGAFRWFPGAWKWISFRYSDFVEVKAKAKITLYDEIMKKRGTFINLALGFLGAWLLFEGNDVFAWITSGDAVTLFLSTLISISPYVEPADITGDFAYVFHWSTGSALLFGLLYLCTFFDSSKKFFLAKLVLSVSFFMITWYLLYFACFLIVMIPVFFYILSAFAVLLIATFVGGGLLSVAECVSEKLDS